MQPTPVFLPGESPGQRSLAGYSLRCLKGSDMTEGTAMCANICYIVVATMDTAALRFQSWPQ